MQLKWYLGGIAGDDVEAGKRIERDQLDGVGAGTWQCERWAPSMTVTRLPGLFHDRDELKYVAARLRPQFEEELKKSGFVYLGDAQIGGSLDLLAPPRAHVRRAAPGQAVDARQRRRQDAHARRRSACRWCRCRSTQSRAAFDRGQVDGFSSPPTGALAFQWSTQARYLLPLATDYILACMVVSTRAFDRLPFEHQRAVRAAAAKFMTRFDDAGAQADDELVGGLFARQGVTTLRADDKMQADFAAAAHAAWDKFDERAVPKALIRQVQAILTAYRASRPIINVGGRVTGAHREATVWACGSGGPRGVASGNHVGGEGCGGRYAACSGE